jgi:cysteinyl-tRNA synthetase
MKKIVLITAWIILVIGCTSDETDTRNYRQDMRDFVQSISQTAKAIDPAFVIIPQNGNELLTDSGEISGVPMADYIHSIDGIGREDLFYGYDGDDLPTPEPETSYMLGFLDIAEQNGVEVLVTDYCWTKSHVNDSYARNAGKGYISFAASHRELDNIPGYPALPYRVNSEPINTLRQARNFLYLLDPELFPDKENFLATLRNTNYDLLIIDLFFEGNTAYSPVEIESLKTKANGGRRLVIAYMSIGEAEDYRYYWQEEWNDNLPDWIEKENDEWPGNFVVRYWDQNWQNIIYKDTNSYLTRIMNAGFDGIYLDRIDAYEYFEN